jgi:hypothetical protein
MTVVETSAQPSQASNALNASARIVANLHLLSVKLLTIRFQKVLQIRLTNKLQPVVTTAVDLLCMRSSASKMQLTRM